MNLFDTKNFMKKKKRNRNAKAALKSANWRNSANATEQIYLTVKISHSYSIVRKEIRCSIFLTFTIKHYLLFRGSFRNKLKNRPKIVVNRYNKQKSHRLIHNTSIYCTLSWNIFLSQWTARQPWLCEISGIVLIRISWKKV